MNNFPIPNKIFFTAGVGTDRHKLKSFEFALREAGIADQNLVTVSSILPPNCKIVSKKEGISFLKPGSITFCVMSRIDTNESFRQIAASVGLAVPADKSRHGYISEAHEYGMSKQVIGEIAEDLAADMLGSTLGINVDPYKDWNEKEQIYKTSGLIIKTQNTSIATKGSDKWTTAIAAAVFIFE